MVVVVFLLFLLRSAHQADFIDTSVVSKIAFGSCSHQVCLTVKHSSSAKLFPLDYCEIMSSRLQDREQPLWSEIARWDPDYFIWLGDAVYTDTRIRPFSWVGEHADSI